jgi:leucyl aminopeptidase
MHQEHLMDYGASSGSSTRKTSGCLVVGAFEKNHLHPGAQALDLDSGGLIKRQLKSGDFSGRAGETLLIPEPAGVKAKRVLLVGLGKASKYDAASARKAVDAAIAAIRRTGTADALIDLAPTDLDGDQAYRLGRHLAENSEAQAYHYGATRADKARKVALRKLTLHIDQRRLANRAGAGCSDGVHVAAGVALSRELGDLPGNVCTPSYLANEARKLGRQYKKITTKVLGEPQMKRLGMGSLLSVSRGSREPAKFIIMEYKGGPSGKKGAPHVLVGKGLTFDAGGISIKPAASMDEMKYDMCGAAGVMGTMRAIAGLKLPINVVGIVPSSENMPDGAANKPGDIVTSMQGTTIEILNTDAEGRLILCDALTYSRRYKPASVIDLATLTGACVVALGSHATGLYAREDDFAEALLNAGIAAGDKAWRMPLWDEYQPMLRSPFADVANIGGREAGSVTAACFLARFTEGLRWAHLDIAGTAWNSGAKKGSTGRPVPMLTEYLMAQAN